MGARASRSAWQYRVTPYHEALSAYRSAEPSGGQVPKWCLPRSRFRLAWDSLLLLLVLYNCAYTPIRVFLMPLMSVAFIVGASVADILIDAFFLIDLGLSFSYAYVDQFSGVTITAREIIARKTARSPRTWVHLLALLPMWVDLTYCAGWRRRHEGLRYLLLLRGLRALYGQHQVRYAACAIMPASV
jgi:hypothetical protein